jgi:hypothetical protein
MAELKTKPTDMSVENFLDGIDDERKRQDSFAILEMMKQITGAEPKMWGDTMVGFGDYHYKYESGREGNTFLTGFSPRKQNLTLYIMAGFDEQDALLNKLGKHKTGKSCLYINKLADVDQSVLKEMIERSYNHMISTNPQP